MRVCTVIVFVVNSWLIDWLIDQMIDWLLMCDQLDDGSNLHLLLYYDDKTQWPSVYKNDSKVIILHCIR